VPAIGKVTIVILLRNLLRIVQNKRNAPSAADEDVPNGSS
jgi:methylenetetrahydrofolate dehydrogenase (NAD+)